MSSTSRSSSAAGSSRRRSGSTADAAHATAVADIASATSPARWLDAFRAPVVQGRVVPYEVADVIQEGLEQFAPGAFTATEADRRRLFDLLTPRPGAFQRLVEMSECGLLAHIFPELATIHRRAPVDPSGRAGAGAQALQTIRRVEALASPATSSRARFSGLLEDVARPELLTLAVLLHDPGTRRDPVQGREALRLAQPVLDRLALEPQAVEAVRFLIRYTRQMARVAFRRDAENPAVVSRFADLVSDEDRLKLLCLMTLATLDAVTPDGLPAWKEDRLWELYAGTSACLAVGAGADAPGPDEAVLAVVLAGRPDDISEEELETFVASLPAPYVAVFGVDSVYSHCRAARGLSPADVHTTLESRGDRWDLTVVTADRPQLFATITGALAVHGLAVHRARVLVTSGGLALAACEFTDAHTFLAHEPGAPRQVHRTLEGALTGAVDVVALLRARAHDPSAPSRRPPIGAVTVSNDGADEATLVVIAADEGPSRLAGIGRVIGTAGYAVELSLTSWDRGQTVDVLHVTRDRQKLSEPEGLALQQELERLLRGGDVW